METKVCAKCKQEKNISGFHSKGKENRYNSWCKECVYAKQKLRWVDRKRKAIELLGKKCQCCGYDKCYAALEFHHVEAGDKEYNWSQLREQKWEKIIKELQKCILVCSNCHREIHWGKISSNLQTTGTENNSLNINNKIAYLIPTGECPVCGIEIYGTKYCSQVCAKKGNRKVKRPTTEILLKQVSELGYCKTGRLYGVSDNAVRKWLKTKENIIK